MLEPHNITFERLEWITHSLHLFICVVSSGTIDVRMLPIWWNTTSWIQSHEIMQATLRKKPTFWFIWPLAGAWKLRHLHLLASWISHCRWLRFTENVGWLPCRGRPSQVVTGAEDATAKVVQIETGKAPTPPQRWGCFFPNFPENTSCEALWFLRC